MVIDKLQTTHLGTTIGPCDFVVSGPYLFILIQILCPAPGVFLTKGGVFVNVNADLVILCLGFRKYGALAIKLQEQRSKQHGQAATCRSNLLFVSHYSSFADTTTADDDNNSFI